MIVQKSPENATSDTSMAISDLIPHQFENVNRTSTNFSYFIYFIFIYLNLYLPLV